MPQSKSPMCRSRPSIGGPALPICALSTMRIVAGSGRIASAAPTSRMIGATTSPSQPPSRARHAAPRRSRIAARVDRFLPERSESLALERRRAVAHFGSGEERLQPRVGGAREQHAAQDLEPLVVREARGDRFAREEAVARLDGMRRRLRRSARRRADAAASSRDRADQRRAKRVAQRDASTSRTQRLDVVGARERRRAVDVIEDVGDDGHRQRKSARRRTRGTDRGASTRGHHESARSHQSETAISPGRIGRVRGSRPRRARLPTYARMPQKIDQLDDVERPRQRQHLPEEARAPAARCTRPRPIRRSSAARGPRPSSIAARAAAIQSRRAATSCPRSAGTSRRRSAACARCR